MPNFKINHKAYTLAEVLITLGIIGIVAAITIPTMISNHQKRVWTAQLQKSYATLNQGFRRMLADDNASSLSQTETFNSLGGEQIEGLNNTKYKQCLPDNDIEGTECGDFYKNLGKYFKIADIRKESTERPIYYLNYNEPALNYKDTTVITLTDGTEILDLVVKTSDAEANTANAFKGKLGNFNIDLNGKKGPNKFGRDVFRFFIADSGMVYPYGSYAISEYECQLSENKEEENCPANRYWKTATENLNFTCQVDGRSYGKACTARVLEEGKMNY